MKRTTNLSKEKIMTTQKKNAQSFHLFASVNYYSNKDHRMYVDKKDLTSIDMSIIKKYIHHHECLKSMNN